MYKTLVLVTHDLSAVQNLCDRCIWLKNGRIAFDGSPKDAVEKYLSHYNQSLNHFSEKVETENTDNQTDLNIKIQNIDILIINFLEIFLWKKMK